MSYLNEGIQIRDTAQVYNLFIDALLTSYDGSLFTPQSENKVSYKRQLSKLELKLALVLATVSRNKRDEIILKKSSLREKLDCGKNELRRVLQNLKSAYIIECDAITYDGNNRYICVKIPASIRGKLLKKSGYIKITANQVEELLKIDDVRALRLAVYQISELHRARTEKKKTKAGTTYTERDCKTSLDLKDFKRISGKYVKTKKYIKHTLAGIKNLFHIENTDSSITFSYKQTFDPARYVEEKKEIYFQVFEETFGDALNNINLCDTNALKNTKNKDFVLKQQLLDKKEDIASGFAELSLQNGIMFATDVFSIILEKFTTTTDVLKHPLKYINVVAKNRKDEIFELELREEQENRTRRTNWSNQKKLNKLKKSYS